MGKLCFYKLKKMPDGEERRVTRKEYRRAVLTDVILAPGRRFSRHTIKPLYQWLRGKDVTSMWVGHSMIGSRGCFPDSNECKELFPNDVILYEAATRVELTMEQYPDIMVYRRP